MIFLIFDDPGQHSIHIAIIHHLHMHPILLYRALFSLYELSAIAQYINNENRMSCERCPLAKTILGIAMAEMMHLQKLGELIVLLGALLIISYISSAIIIKGRMKKSKA